MKIWIVDSMICMSLKFNHVKIDDVFNLAEGHSIYISAEQINQNYEELVHVLLDRPVAYRLWQLI